VGVYRTAEIFQIPPIISGTGKAYELQILYAL